VSDIQLVPISTLDMSAFTEAYNAAYSDYLLPVHATPKSLVRLRESVDVDFTASVAARDRAGIIRGFGLLAVRDQRAWVSSVAVLPAFRRQGIARQIMQRLERNARQCGCIQVQLEVNAHNAPAIALYEGLSYTVRRRSLTVDRETPPPHTCTVPIQRTRAADLMPLFDAMHPVRPPWQRESQSLQQSGLEMAGWRAGDPVAAYITGYAWDGIIHMDDAAFADGQAQALADLIGTLHGQYPEALCRMMHLGDDEPAWNVLLSLGFEIVSEEHEMVKLLTTS